MSLLCKGLYSSCHNAPRTRLWRLWLESCSYTIATWESQLVSWSEVTVLCLPGGTSTPYTMYLFPEVFKMYFILQKNHWKLNHLIFSIPNLRELPSFPLRGETDMVAWPVELLHGGPWMQRRVSDLYCFLETEGKWSSVFGTECLCFVICACFFICLSTSPHKVRKPHRGSESETFTMLCKIYSF